jgi:acetyl-CoA C-acetyltransferase
MGTAVIVEAVRTPVGKRGGVLSGVHAAEILGGVQTALIGRAGIAPAEVEQVAGGCGRRASSRKRDQTAWLHAGLAHDRPPDADAQCGSAQQAAHVGRADRGGRDRADRVRRR